MILKDLYIEISNTKVTQKKLNLLIIEVFPNCPITSFNLNIISKSLILIGAYKILIKPINLLLISY